MTKPLSTESQDLKSKDTLAQEILAYRLSLPVFSAQAVLTYDRSDLATPFAQSVV